MAYGSMQRITTEMAFEAALKRAQERAQHSFFDQHVIEERDGEFVTIDEGDYDALPAWMVDKVAYTVPGMMSDEF